ncbi:hypothetical protein [Stenotrophomonas sp. MMGLT7]|uniref:hypothetical protein n=1 Tax=Stenotrophomonas sp. MMGLT7 TaxID=2901227 RepID=UPI001E38F944|nr:hypothetical protein [Stenotrophomonas sp. MMGLT7]MCD7098833.1 hypothetical protein [Stenotrophomonas sp. MMGLT7]
MSARPAKELPDSSTWLNARPATLGDYRGRPLVLAFVNAASAWCMQRVGELAQWSARNPGRAQAIVVQVPRFDSERDPAHSLKLLRRQGAAMPALLDRDWRAWRDFAVESWPTLVLLDSRGEEHSRLVGAQAGDLEKTLNMLCEDALPRLDEDFAGTAEANAEPRATLSFPMGLAATEERLYIADSGHHRILECDHGGRVLRSFGLGIADFVDGGIGEAAFRRPQGVALLRDALYVADTGNHALRRINLSSGHVDTLCGSGRAGEPVEGVVSQPRQVSLNQPRDLVVAHNQVHLAMAGDNRIWSYDLGRRELHWRAGSGALESRDGSGHLAAFSQPTGLAQVQHTLYVCDALASSVRSLQIAGDRVQTLVGGRGNWEFGDADGPRGQASLQYPQAIALSPEAPLLWIADSGNGRLRVLRLGGGELSTVALPRPLHGPAGLAATDDAVWIAETDAHALLKYQPATGQLHEIPIQE